MDHYLAIRTHLTALYGETAGETTFERLRDLLSRYSGRIPAARLTSLSQRDAILITYGDQVTQPGSTPLKTLTDFCVEHLSGAISGVHFLPFYPYTSDDGFSIVDYQAVDPALGSWTDVAHFGQYFLMMFDAVINHMSQGSAWFHGFLHGDPRYRDYFIAVPEDADLSMVVRPRTLPLLTTFQVNGQPQKIWTTFSADQVDLNFRNPAVLLDVLDVLLSYVEHGAELIRLDAIAFLWKTYGTSCLHLPQTHRVIQLIRSVLDQVAPQVILITETNVPHADNLSYFGDGSNEAQLVYNFALPPLVMHSLQTGSAQILSDWAAGLRLPSKRTTFFNFLASHDGIGLNPARGILSPEQIDDLVKRVQQHGGLISYKNNPDGSTSPYELNINYFDALSNPDGLEALEIQVDRFMASQAIMLAVLGVPGIYFQSMFGSRGWRDGVRQTGHNRTINRQKFTLAELEAELAAPGSIRQNVFTRFTRLLRIRASQPAFDPYGEMSVVNAGEPIFAVFRTSGEAAPVLCLQNVSDQLQSIPTTLLNELGMSPQSTVDLVSGQQVGMAATLLMRPYQTMWLTRMGK
jgi:glucosylglycerate phosphorylase